MLDLKPDQLAMVRSILSRELPNTEVWAFGSRTKGTAKPTSDLDLAVITEKPLSLNKRSHLRDAFSESNLPFTVDIADWAQIDDEFKNVIKDQRTIIQSPK